MTKKKLAIYALMLSILFGAFFMCLKSMTGVYQETTEQRLTNNIQMIKRQMESNIKLRSKDLLLLNNKFSLNAAQSVESLLSEIKEIPTTKGTYHIIDIDGVIHSVNGETITTKIDEKAIKLAYANGYYVASVTKGTSSQKFVCLFSPISENSPYLIAEIITPQEYLESIVLEDMPLSVETAFIFDEWATMLASYGQQEGEAPLGTELTDHAVSFSLDESKNIYNSAKKAETYCVFIPTNSPNGWFIGVPISNVNQGMTQMSFFLPLYLVMLSMILVLGVVIFLDVVNDQERTKKQLVASTIDQLTGLLNVEGMYQAMKTFSKNHNMSQYHFVCMDIVNFSRINTMFGYSFGDTLLCSVAHVISQNEHCCTRISADSFAFLTEYSEEKLKTIETMLNEAISVHLGKEYLQMVEFNFGLFPIEDNTLDYAKIYDGARLALTIAKKKSDTTKIIYDKVLMAELELQKNIELNMIHALSKGEFAFFVQPQFTMPSEICSRGEALIRWDSETMGFLPPDKFIPIFENNGFIVEVDFFMLKSALAFLQRRHNEGKPPICIAVNQSKATVSFPNYYQRIRETIMSYSVPLQYIELEITESTLDADINMIIPLLNKIKELGFTIALDDFGSGFSSLNTLRILPIDVLKIDRIFLQESDASERSRTIIKNVINLAKDLSMEVVCEGVETVQQVEFLKNAECDILQGYHYSKPIPLEDFVSRFLKEE